MINQADILAFWDACAHVANKQKLSADTVCVSFVIIKLRYFYELHKTKHDIGIIYWPSAARLSHYFEYPELVATTTQKWSQY